LDRHLGLSAVGHFIEPLKEKYREYQRVLAYLDEVQEDILLNLEDFKGVPQAAALPGLKLPTQAPSFERYAVNLFVDNCEQCGAPVVYEANPPTTTCSAASTMSCRWEASPAPISP
jgi:hypothetical protein